MLTLRPYKDYDADSIVEWLDDERTFRLWCTNKYSDYPITPDDMNDFYHVMECLYPMTAEDDEGIVGHLALRYVNRGHTDVLLTYVIIDSEKRGRGYGKEMVRMAAKFALEFMNAQKVCISAFDGNSNPAAYFCYLAAGLRDVTDWIFQPYIYKDEEWYHRKLELEPEWAREAGIIP